MKLNLKISLFLILTASHFGKSELTTISKTFIQTCSPEDFLKLKDKHLQEDFFAHLDSIRKVQYPNNNQDTNIFVDLTPKLLSRFLKDIDKDILIMTGRFEREYHFNIAPPGYSDPEICKDKISLLFNTESCSFRMIIYNTFFAEWCQESSVVYVFQINGNRITEFWRNEAG